MESQAYIDAEIVDLDWILTPITRKKIKDGDYWVDAKISKNSKGDVQVMVLAWNKKEKNKTQLFLATKHERLGFDRSNNHPSEVFTKVNAVFKNSKSSIH